MSDALALPPRPNIEQYKKLARDFQKACRAGDDGAVHQWAERWVASLGPAPTKGDERRILRRWRELRKSNDPAGRSLAGAQLLIARCHGFASWPKFVAHLEEVSRANSHVSVFEAAVDMIVEGEIDALRNALRDHPGLARERSTREHGATLLHYVAANGVEDFRQKTPGNIVAIARLLLDSGAEINAESEAYGGPATTLGLAATSCHPAAAGVQLALLDLLIERGASIDAVNGVNACLRNGRGEAAEHLASKGAALDLEGAAGTGRLAVVKSFFDDDGGLKPRATRRQLMDGFAWACEFGRSSVVEFLLDHGVKADAKLSGGETGLHWVAFAGHADLVRLLLERGAPVHVMDKTHGGTALDWALYGWGTRRPGDRTQSSYYETVACLARSGSKVDPNWFVRNAERETAAGRIRSDPAMMSALRGEFPRKV